MWLAELASHLEALGSISVTYKLFCIEPDVLVFPGNSTLRKILEDIITFAMLLN